VTDIRLVPECAGAHAVTLYDAAAAQRQCAAAAALAAKRR
jgi:hypothetical protein